MEEYQSNYSQRNNEEKHALPYSEHVWGDNF